MKVEEHARKMFKDDDNRTRVAACIDRAQRMLKNEQQLALASIHRVSKMCRIV